MGCRSDQQYLETNAHGAQARYFDDLSSPEPRRACDEGRGRERGSMRGTYQGLPPAKSVEQAIILAQRLIARDLERRKTALAERWDQNDHEEKKCA